MGALAHSTRLRIVRALSQNREVTPNEFAEMLGESQQNVSKHLKTLAHAGIVVGRKDGSSTLYSLRDVLPHLLRTRKRSAVRLAAKHQQRTAFGALPGYAAAASPPAVPSHADAQPD